MAENEAAWKNETSTLMAEQKLMLLKTEDLIFKIENMDHTIKQFEEQINGVRKDFERVNLNMAENKESIISQVTSAISKVNTHLDELENRTSSIFIKNEYNESLAQSHESKIVEISAHLKQAQDQYEILQAQFFDLNNTKVNKMDHDIKANELQKMIQEIELKNELRENQVKTVENFIEKYLPVRVQS